MRSEVHRRWREFAARMPLAELGIRNLARVAVRIAEMLRDRREVIERVRRNVVAHHVAAVAREPQLLRPGIPIEADRVADTAGVGLAAPAG